MKKNKDKFKLILSGLTIGIVNGFFGGGGGMICVPLLEKILTQKRNRGTTKRCIEVVWTLYFWILPIIMVDRKVYKILFKNI